MQKADARPSKRDGVSQKRPTIDRIPESLEERPGGGSRLIRALLATPAKVKHSTFGRYSGVVSPDRQWQPENL